MTFETTGHVKSKKIHRKIKHVLLYDQKTQLTKWSMTVRTFVPIKATR